MTDRELLEMAAKAAGFGGKDCKFCWTEAEYPRHSGQNGALWNYIGHGDSAVLWNPLTDDGDALRLAVKLGITIGPESPDVIGKSLCRASWNNRSSSLGEYGDGDIYAATRRAIVRAAAEIGRGIE